MSLKNSIKDSWKQREKVFDVFWMCNFIEVFDKILFCSSQRLYQLQKAKMNIIFFFKF